jgi:hypothetical protein
MDFMFNKRLSLLLLIILLFISAFSFAKPAQTIKNKAHKIKTPTKQERTDAFYDSLRVKAGGNWLFRNLYPAVFVVDSVEATIHVEDKTFDNWKGKIIRSINIERVEVFPSDSTEVLKHADNILKRIGNKVHVQTREWVIRDNLLFHTGDKLVPAVLRRNVSYLRNLNYLTDVRFYIISTQKKADSVDVLIVVQDKFSINLNEHFSNFSKFRINLDDQNFLGLGNQLRNELRYDTKYPNPIGWASYYTVPNIHRTFIQGELGWAEMPGYSAKSAALNRPFLFPVLKAAGGADIIDTYVRAPVDTIAVDKTVLGGWGGYCVRGSPGPANQYVYAALGLKQSWFSKRPPVGITYGKLYHESLLAIGSLAITQSEYLRLPYMYSFLENEDIPVGFLYEFLYGYEFGEFRNREFLGLRGARGVSLENTGFLYLKGGLESFITKYGLEQSVVNFEPLYITPLKSIGKFHTRTFYRQRIVIGIKRFAGESLKLSTDTYFRGSKDLEGDNLIAVGAEKDFISPWNVIGFEFAFFGFLDGALVANNYKTINNKNLLTTEGVGIRIRNPHLVWKSFELHVAANQNKGKFDSVDIALIAKVPIKMVDFEGRRPEPYNFR